MFSSNLKMAYNILNTIKKASNSYSTILNITAPFMIKSNLKNGKILYKNIETGFFKKNEIIIITINPTKESNSVNTPLLKPIKKLKAKKTIMIISTNNIYIHLLYYMLLLYYYLLNISRCVNNYNIYYFLIVLIFYILYN